MNKIMKVFFRFLAEIIIAAAIIVGIKILTDGMYLLGLPDLKNIQTVSISYPNVTDEIKEATSKDDIELALKLTGFLKYDLFEKADGAEEPLVTITYHLKDGTDQTISANKTTVWWNGTCRVLKDKEMFINLTEGIFFLEDLQE